MDETFLRTAYTFNNRTLQSIADDLGCSRQNVWAAIKRYGIKHNAEKWIAFTCDGCGKLGSMLKTQFVKSTLHFHGKPCYTQYQHSPEFREGRAAERIARVTIEEQNKINRI